MVSEGSDHAGDDRVQLNVTFRHDTLRRLQDLFPTALEDSERVRQAVDRAVEQSGAVEFTIRRE